VLNLCIAAAVTHSGLTLAPLVGQLAAQEILATSSQHNSSSSSSSTAQQSEQVVGSSKLQATAAELLAPYRPDRDFQAAVAAAAAQPGLSWAATLQPSNQL
jgi:hypothetical protein